MCARACVRVCVCVCVCVRERERERERERDFFCISDLWWEEGGGGGRGMLVSLFWFGVVWFGLVCLFVVVRCRTFFFKSNFRGSHIASSWTAHNEQYQGLLSQRDAKRACTD